MLAWMITNLLLSKVLFANTTFITNKVFKITENNKEAKVVVLKSLVASSQLQCVHRCKLQTGCENINYNMKTRECELLDGSNEDQEELQSYDNWVHAGLLQEECQFPLQRAENNGLCPILHYPNEFTITKNNLLATIPIWSPSWKISFNIRPFGIRSDWGSILHLSIGQNFDVYGDRVPGLWFYTLTKIHHGSAINGNKNLIFSSNQELLLNRMTHIEISQLYQSNGKYLYSIKVNGTEIYSIINNNATQFYNVKVYAGDPWYEPAKATISNLLIMNFL